MPQQVDPKTQVKDLVATIEQIRGSRVIVYWMADVARISEAVIAPLYDQLSGMGRQSTLDLVLHTHGGDTEVPWRIVSLIREYCDRFAVLVPYRALSAGTVLALGADEIVMTPLSVLGPIDPSRTHPLLPRREGSDEAEPISVQDMRHAMQFIREAAAPRPEEGANQVPGVAYTPEALAQIFAALFDKIHPLAIGAIEQSYALAKLIGRQCLSTHMDPAKDAAEINRIVDKLCDDYKSHAYQIGRREARAIGLKVVDAPKDLEDALTKLLRFYLSRPVLQADPSTLRPGATISTQLAWLDSRDMYFHVKGQAQLLDGGAIKPLGDAWMHY